MKHCPSCGASVESNAKFCIYCGTPLPSEAPTPPVSPPPVKKRSALPIVLSIVGVVLLIGAIAAGIYLKNSRTAQTTETTVEDTTTISNPSGEFFGDDEEETAVEETPEVSPTETETVTSQSGDASAPTIIIRGEVIGDTTNSDTQTGTSSSSSNSNSSSTAVSGSSRTYQGVTITGDYVLAESSSRYYTRSELSSLNKTQLRLARNEIFARHGRLFNDDALQEYFNSCDWYYGYIQPDDFNLDVMFNDYEKANVNLISQLEDELGG